MKFELNLLGQWVADQDPSVTARQWENEAARIREVFMTVALSHKRDGYLRRYFRLHQEGLNSLVIQLQDKAQRKRQKQLLSIYENLLVFMKDHFGQFLLTSTEAIDPDDPDIDSKKVITTFSLAELGVIIRLFIDVGIFRVRNRKALTRFMSRNVVIRTKQLPGTFSENHLYNAIHSPAVSAIDRLQEVLNRMQAELGKLRREQRKKLKL